MKFVFGFLITICFVASLNARSMPRADDSIEDQDDILKNIFGQAKNALNEVMTKGDEVVDALKKEADEAASQVGGAGKSVEKTVDSIVNMINPAIKEAEQHVIDAIDTTSKKINSQIEKDEKKIDSLEKCAESQNIKLPKLDLNVNTCLKDASSDVHGAIAKFTDAGTDIMKILSGLMPDISNCIQQFKSLTGLAKGPLCFTSFGLKVGSKLANVIGKFVAAGLNVASVIVGIVQKSTDCGTKQMSSIMHQVSQAGVDLKKCDASVNDDIKPAGVVGRILKRMLG